MFTWTSLVLNHSAYTSAGRIGSSNEGIDIGNGITDAKLDIISLRLNVSLSLPNVFID